MNIAGHVLANKINGTRPPKHMTQKGNGRPGQKFDADRFAELCAQHKLDPAEEALKLLADLEVQERLKPKDRLDAYTKLMEYIYPKKKSVESTGTMDASLTVNVRTDFGD